MVTGKRIHKHQLKYKYAKKAGHDEEKTKNIVAAFPNGMDKDVYGQLKTLLP